MTPKEKAQKIFFRFNTETYMQQPYDHNLHMSKAKQSALICVDEVLEQWDYIDTYLADMNGELNPNLKYWQLVKKEIELITN